MSEELRGSSAPSGAVPLEPEALEQRRQHRQPGRPAHRERAARRERSRPSAGLDPEEDIEEPSESARLRVKSVPVNFELSAHGPLALAIVGPAATMSVGHLAEVPVWAILAICALQILAAMVMRRRR
jgi:hypothetical protein